MDIKTFLEQTDGEWFSQRTIYNLTEEENEVTNAKANLTVQVLPSDEDQVVNIIKDFSLNTDAILGAISSTWDNSPDWGKPKEQGSTVLVLVQNEENSQAGKIFRVINKPDKKVITGQYILGKDEALTLILEQNNHSIEERIWFASPNLRMRTIIYKRDQKCIKTSFYSEIKRIVKK